MIRPATPPAKLGRSQAHAATLPVAIKALAILGAVLVIVLVLLLPDPQQLVLPETNSAAAGVYIFDRFDNLICRLDGDQNSMPVPLSKVSRNVQAAILAAEDHRFYSHHGIDLLGALRALLTDIHAGRAVEGGSTITQQLVKNLYFKGAPRTPWQKCRELVAAALIEMRYSKERILETYLNEIYFGNGAYGIERAAQVYFGKEPSQLSLAESAFLSGLVRAPATLGSSDHRLQAMDREREVLTQIAADGYVGEAEARAIADQSIKFKQGQCALKYPYYVSYVMEILKGRFGAKGLKEQGLRVYTNLDPAAEDQAERALAQEIKKAPSGITQAALVSVAVPDGAIIALAGGVGDYWSHQWNRATNPHTAGSAFKPFVYLAALNNHTLAPDSTIDDLPLTVPAAGGQNYRPRDFDGQFLGPLSIRKALALSRNVCAVRVAQAVGINNVIDTAHKAGITSRLDQNLSLALGSSAVSPLELAGAYATLARYGVAIEPSVLRRIDDPSGKTLITFAPKPVTQFAAEPVAELVDGLQDVVKNGTGKAAQLDRPVAGKTGTSDQSKDVWFVGFTPDLVTAVWSGNDGNRPIAGSRATGGAVAARCWHDYMTAYYQTHATVPGAFLSPSYPLAPESDFNAQPSHPVWDTINSLLGNQNAKSNSQEKPGLLHRLWHRVLGWF